MNFTGKKVVLLGYGVENRAMLRYLLSQKAFITIRDQNPELTIEHEENELIAYHLGEGYLKDLDNYEIIFRSPGIPYQNHEIQQAKQRGVVITSQTKLFLQDCPARIIGVTGTKGKSTTASLIKSILQMAKEKNELKGEVYLAGNIGVTPVQFLEKLTADDWVVLELSSFQLQDVDHSPHIAVILTVGIDHLDHHRDEVEYITAKKNIVRYQTPDDYLVVHLGSLTSIQFAEETAAATYFFSRTQSVDQGAFVAREGERVIRLRLPPQTEREICKVKDLKLIGDYNLENVTAAVCAAALAGISRETIKEGLTNFTGLPHRLQQVFQSGGVRYFDDSKSTTPESTIAAIESFQEPITLIVGGSSKGADFSELVETIEKSTVQTIICIGQEGDRLRELLVTNGSNKRIIEGGGTMEEIVRQASHYSQTGGLVLLSPAAASFDMFLNAEDRGDQFQKAIRELTI